MVRSVYTSVMRNTDTLESTMTKETLYLIPRAGTFGSRKPALETETMTEETMTEETTLKDLNIDIPRWIDQDIDNYQVQAIVEGGCASGAYMPAVTYHEARETMNEHGDDVLDFIEDAYGELPTVPEGSSWSGMAVHYLSCAVEIWANRASSVVELLQEEGS